MKLREKGYGTFAVTTDGDFNRLPPKNATSLRLSNLSGKLVGIRNRHSVHVIEDFESGYDAWTVHDGTFEKFGGTEIQDSNSPQLMGRVVTQLPTITKESIIEISFRVLSGSLKVGLFDSIARADLIAGGTTGTTISFLGGGSILTSAPSVSTATWELDKVYRLAIEVHPDIEKFTADLFLDEARQNIGQGLDTTNDAGGGGGIIEPAENFQLCISANSAVIDEVLLLNKESYPHEIVANGSSFVFPCQRAIDEYEIVNLGSDARNFVDNTEIITLTGFYQ